MAVAAVVDHDVQVAQGVGREGLPEIVDQFAVELADLGRRESRPGRRGKPGRSGRPRRSPASLPWAREVAVAADARLVAQGLCRRPARDRCPRLRPCGAGRRARSPTASTVRSMAACLARSVSMWSKKAHAGGDLRLARAVEVESRSICVSAVLRSIRAVRDMVVALGSTRSSASSSCKSHQLAQPLQAGVDLLVACPR